MLTAKNILSDRCHTALLPVEEESQQSLLTCPIHTFDLDLDLRGAALDICSALPTVDVFSSDYTLSSPSPCQNIRMKSWPEGSLRSLYILESLPKNELKYYNNFTMHFPSPKGYIQAAVELLILMIQDTMAPLWLHCSLRSLFFTLHLGDTHPIFYLLS